MIHRIYLPILLLCLAGCATLRGCQGGGLGDGAERLRKAGEHAADTATSLGGLGNIALGFVALGGLALVASFVPFLSAFVPRKAAVASIVFGLGLYVASAFFAGFMAKFGDAIYWVFFVSLIAIGLCAIWPYLVAAHKGTLRMTLLGKSDELLAAGHVDAAAAFKITATPGAEESPTIRKAILASVAAQAPPPKGDL